jgi:hypothetical protein
MTRGDTRWKADYSSKRSVDVKPSEPSEEPSPTRTASSRSVRQAKDPKDFGGDYDAIRAELQKGDGWGAGYSMASVLNTVSNNSFGEATCMDGAVHALHSMHTTPHFRRPTRRHHTETMVLMMDPTVVLLNDVPQISRGSTCSERYKGCSRPCRQGWQRDLQVYHGHCGGPPTRAEQR